MELDIVARRAELTPDRPAVYFRGRWYRYGELNQRAQKLAARLHALGVSKGERVGILAPNHLAHFDLLLAAPKLGFIYTPFNYRLSGTEQKALGQYIEPKLMLHDEKCAVLARGTGAALQSLDTYETWLASAPDSVPNQPAMKPEDVAMILFTGGSTGLPKGAMISYRQLFYNAVNTCFSWGLSENDCAVQATPAFHAAFNVLATPLLHAGGRIVMQENFEAGDYLKLVAAHKVSVMFLVPTMFQMLAEHADFERADLSSVRWAISGGAACPEPVQARYKSRGILFKQGFGMTEAGVNCFAIEISDAQKRPGTVGKPMLHAQAVIRDESGAAAPRGTVGELTLAGPHLMLGYYQRPEETAKTLRDGWLWTGDLARQDEDGFFYIVGRSKDMYISGGENVYPIEIETVLYQQPEIAEAAVVGVPHERWGETGLAAIALKPGRTLEPEDLRARLKRVLAGYKVPGHYLFLETLPKSAAGKMLKPQIRRLFQG